ncbi:11886_t:CDS:10 [Ambispora gerdemannii]|uniref:11886_t:CDS:1 n=1 Tax=Ambispora gerdemannii TaxID=144530 RepID=A0A9N9A041_9GLOM|nr:11886_t:CDS:10 [Ambispora gerdemannii]
MNAHSQVELKLSCKNLPDLDYFSKSDPQVVLFVQDLNTQQWVDSRQKTEVVMNNLNPKFVTSFVLDYHFEMLQKLRFTVVDVDKHDNSDWKVQEYVGSFETDLGSIVGSPYNRVIGKLIDSNHPDKNRGSIVIFGEEVSITKRIVNLQFQAHNVIKKSIFSSSKPKIFFVVGRANEDGTYSPVYKSGLTSPSLFWPVFSIKESLLCNGDQDRGLEILIKKQKENGNHRLLAKSTVTLRELLSTTTNNKPFQLSRINASGEPEKEKSSKNQSYIRVIQCSVQEEPSFLDYIGGGTEINLVVGIDFTQSNGSPHDIKSLHYIDERGENDYQKTIRSVGAILQAYDHDKKIPVYGFGGKFGGVLSHAYPLNGDFKNPEVKGVEGILAAYLQTINNVELYGPTNFSPIIKQTADTVRQNLASGRDNVYYILLIITDMDTTVRTIVEASSLPFSIVIVGVGNANFTAMHDLDADYTALEANNKKAERDIVQFVAMREFESAASHHLLPKAVLEEIPDQIMSYMQKHAIGPRPFKRIETEMQLNLSSGDNDPPPAYPGDQPSDIQVFLYTEGIESAHGFRYIINNISRTIPEIVVSVNIDPNNMP